MPDKSNLKKKKGFILASSRQREHSFYAVRKRMSAGHVAGCHSQESRVTAELWKLKAWPSVVTFSREAPPFKSPMTWNSATIWGPGSQTREAEDDVAYLNRTHLLCLLFSSPSCFSFMSLTVPSTHSFLVSLCTKVSITNVSCVNQPSSHVYYKILQCPHSDQRILFTSVTLRMYLFFFSCFLSFILK